MYRQQFYSIRQNPRGITNQKNMKDFIISQEYLTCPFGHLAEERNNVINGDYNEKDKKWSSNSQDRKFIEDINIGDIVIITFSGIKECILARIVSEPIYGYETGLYVVEKEKEFQILKEGKIPFRPVVRRIQIIKKDVIFDDKRVLSMKSLSHINPKIIPV